MVARAGVAAACRTSSAAVAPASWLRPGCASAAHAVRAHTTAVTVLLIGAVPLTTETAGYRQWGRAGAIPLAVARRTSVPGEHVRTTRVFGVTDQRDEQDGVGDPDAFERLWTPHRIAYIKGENKPASSEAADCPFCRIPSLDDADGLIVHRGESAYAVLNLYPYNAGHLLVCPYRHVADYTELTDQETAEVAALTKQAMRVMRTVTSPQGFNLGLNQGQAAGAGIAAHLHQHIVPRWGGDANFMPVIGHTKTMPQLLGDTREMLAAAWPKE
ncbi:HIT domain-containing protein [Aeromicrobium yanjiei]|uniref:HIT domain-containing protein n=1 Tax=Aeromicrobium yanjiei TaxID=2662028 RepID=A0A5Q2MMS1_9ACTN|nr:HIT domain-containing protein [Aeromicrobium yanjiei]